MRKIVPEILDELPSDHPDAIASRRDLTRINRVMGNYQWITKQLNEHARPTDQIIELGAGGGQLIEFLPDFSIPIIGVDFADRPAIWPADWDWQQANFFEGRTQADVMICSLVLHHFDSQQLKTMIMNHCPEIRMLILAEPSRRWWAHLWGAFAELGMIHSVTRHDMHCSIRAGFKPGELASALQLDPNHWRVHESEDWRGSIRMLACRK
ncbi:MAG: hypothetical protein AAFY98_03340 [Verrucomicrobiota bacterium]